MFDLLPILFVFLPTNLSGARRLLLPITDIGFDASEHSGVIDFDATNRPMQAPSCTCGQYAPPVRSTVSQCRSLGILRLRLNIPTSSLHEWT